ncbi:exosortase/archaeosortase family protein [bacterium]|nr:exosortase/archaeosortase family protein [bacterium]
MVREDEHLNGVDGLAMPSKWLAASLSFILISAILFYPVFSSLPGRSLALWTWLACNSYNGFLHGRLVPLVFLWMLWMVWQRRENDTCKPSIMGVGLLLLGLLFFLVAMRLTQPRVALLGLPFVVLGLVHFWFGGRVARAAIFPAFFLWFMIPIPVLQALVSGMWRVEMMTLSYEIGTLLGMDLAMTGLTIEMKGSGLRFAEG